MIDVCRKWKCMELSNPIFFYDLKCILKISIIFVRESDNKISSDIHHDIIFSLKSSEFSENFTKAIAIIVSIHRLQYFR